MLKVTIGRCDALSRYWKAKGGIERTPKKPRLTNSEYSLAIAEVFGQYPNKIDDLYFELEHPSGKIVFLDDVVIWGNYQSDWLKVNYLKTQSVRYNKLVNSLRKLKKKIDSL